MVDAQPSGASAATVSFDSGADPGRGTENPSFSYEAGRRERSDLRVTRSGRSYAFRTRGNRMRAGRGCVQHGPHRVLCHDRPQAALLVGLGARNDRADVRVGKASVSILVFGGAGNDRLRVRAPRAVEDVQIYGGAGSDVITGSDGKDTLDGGGSSAGDHGAGNDVIRGGKGNDTIMDGDLLRAPRRDHDTIDGGPGRDKLDMNKRERAVTIDLTAGRGGGSGEHDRIRGIEDVTGGDGSDTLIGNRDANVLEGGDKGKDTVVGGDGRDDLTGAQVDGGPGDDKISASAQASCGAGLDAVSIYDLRQPAPLLANDCERVSAAGWLEVAPYPIMLTADGRATFQIACRRSNGMCRGTLALGTASAPFAVPAGAMGSVEVGLSAAELTALSSPGKLRANVVLTLAPGTPEATPGPDQVTGSHWIVLLPSPP